MHREHADTLTELSQRGEAVAGHKRVEQVTGQHSRCVKCAASCQCFSMQLDRKGNVRHLVPKIKEVQDDFGQFR